MEVHRYEAALLEEIRQLPAEQVREVLDFAAFLRHRLAQHDDRQRRDREVAATRMTARRARVGPVGFKAADLVAEGRAARLKAILPAGECP
jgi:hypothetical protein